MFTQGGDVGMERVRIINLTPHQLNIYDLSGEAVILSLPPPPEGTPIPRVATSSKIVGTSILMVQRYLLGKLRMGILRICQKRGKTQYILFQRLLHWL
jgi:hypothetical protein